MTDNDAPVPDDGDGPDTEDILEEAKEAFKRVEDADNVNREAYVDDTRFAKLDEQWPEAIRQQRMLDGRPCLTINKLRPVIKQIVNDARQNTPSIKVHPADSNADPDTAEVYDGLIRNIEVTSKADVAYDTALDCAVTGGFGYFRINTKHTSDDTFDLDIVIEAVPDPLTVWGDPYSSSSDSSDWNTAFVTEMLPKDEFKRKYKNAEPVDWESDGYGQLDDPWLTDDCVLVAEYWKRIPAPRKIVMLSTNEVVPEDEYVANKPTFDAAMVTVVGSRVVQSHKVMQYVMTGAEVLQTREWPGRYIPIVPVYGEEVNVGGRRYLWSLIRSAKDSQLNFNYWRTTATELVALAPKAPYIGVVGQFKTDTSKWETANNENHAYIEYDLVAGAPAPQRQAFAGVPAGAIQEALNAADDIKSATGLYDASMGARSNETSGRAILARQREGDVSTFNFTDNLSRSIEHAGRVIIDLIPSVYTGQRTIRVLGMDGKPQTIQLGVPQPVPGPNGQPQVQQQPDGTAVTLTRMYDLSVGKYDLTVEAGPSYTTKREETANQIIELAKMNPQIMTLAGDILVKSLDWDGAEEIAKRFEAMLPAQVKGQNPEVQAIQQQAHQAVGQAMQHAQQTTQQAQQLLAQKDQEIQSLQQQLQAKAGDLQVKSQANQVDMYDAQTKRLEAETKANESRMKALGAAGILPGAFDPTQGQVAPVQPADQF